MGEGREKQKSKIGEDFAGGMLSDGLSGKLGWLLLRIWDLCWSSL